jgi:hypothetical protein
MHFAGFSYNLEIMDLLFLFLFLSLLILLAMANIRKHRIRLEAIEKHLNIPEKK